MSVISINGRPGMGKSVLATYRQLVQYRKENGFFRRCYNKITKKPLIYNNVYSNFPICLDRKKQIYSRKFTLYDFEKFWRYPMDTQIVIDEIQAYYDSSEWKDVPANVRTNFQFHRHFGIKNIFIISQDPGRVPTIFKKLAEEFHDIDKFYKFKIPFTNLGIGLLKINVYYRVEDFGLPTCVRKKEVAYKFSKKWRFFSLSGPFNSYDTKCMSALVENEPMLDNENWTSLKMSKQDILDIFRLDIENKGEKKKK